MIDRLSKMFSSQGMAGRVLRGGAILGMGSMSEQGLRFVRNMILTRILTPKEFGLMAIVLSVCSLIQVLTSIGVKESVVQNPEGAKRTFLNGAWWLSFGRGCVIYLIAFIAAPWIADYYDKEQLTWLMRLAFLQVVAQGAFSVGAFVAIKEMRYKPWVIIQNGGSAIGIILAIILGWKMQSAVGLVLGFVAEATARCVLSHLICPFRPGWDFDRGHLRALFAFARQMFGLPLLMLVYTEGSILIAGKFFATYQLGVFSMAMTLARVPSMFASLFVDLLMPAFSEIQKHPERVNQGILKVTTAILMMALPGWLFLFFYGREVLTLVYGAEYAWGDNLLIVLFANEMLAICSVPLATVYMAVGQPALLRKFSFFRGLAVLVLIWPLTNEWGITGMAMTPLIAMASSYGLQLANIGRLTGLQTSKYAGTVVRCLALSIPAGIFWLCTHSLFQSGNPKITLLRVTVATLVFFGVALAVVMKNPFLRQRLMSLIPAKR